MKTKTYWKIFPLMLFALLTVKMSFSQTIIETIEITDFPVCSDPTGEITVSLTNIGTESIDEFDILYALNGDTIDPVETIFFELAPGDTVEYTFTTPVNISNTGNYEVYVTTLVNGDDPEFNIFLSAQKVVFGTDLYDDWISYNTCTGMPDNNIRDIIIDSDGNIWIAMPNIGIAQFDSETEDWILYNSENTVFTNDQPFALLEDHLGNIWASFDGDDGTVAMYDGTDWIIDNPDNTHVLSMLEDHEENMWFGTWCCGIRKWERTTDTWITYTMDNSGLTSNDMCFNGIMEDSEHNMWFSMLGWFNDNGGLTKFDGINWTVYNMESSDYLNSNVIIYSHMDSHDNIWLGCVGSPGIIKFDGSDWTYYNSENSGLICESIGNAFEDSHGNMWISAGSGLCYFDGYGWSIFDNTNSGFAAKQASAMIEDENGDLWFASNSGLYKFNVPDAILKTVDFIDFPVCGDENSVLSVSLTNVGIAPISGFDILFAVNGDTLDVAETAMITINPGDTVEYTFTETANLSLTGYYTVYVSTLLNDNDPCTNIPFETEKLVFGMDQYDDWTSYSICNGLPDNQVQYIMEDSQGNMWAGTEEGGVVRFNTGTGTWDVFNSDNSDFSNNQAISILEDHEENIWVALDEDDGIVMMYDGNDWIEHNASNNHVVTLFEDHNGDMWFGTWGYGVRKWERTTDTWTSYTTENSELPSNILWYGAIMEDEDYNMWFSTWGINEYPGGLARFDGSNWTIYNTDNSNLMSNVIVASHMDSKDRIWMAFGNSAEGVMCFDREGAWSAYASGFAGENFDDIVNIYEDHGGNLWFSDTGDGIFKYDGYQCHNYNSSNSGLMFNSIVSINEDSEGNMWFASGNGLYRYNLPDQIIKTIDLSGIPDCGDSEAEITVQLTNIGTLPVYAFDIVYAINEDTLDLPETVNITLNPGDTIAYTFSAKADVSLIGNYNVFVTTLLNSGDQTVNIPYESDYFVFGVNPYEDWVTYSTCNGLPGNGVFYIMEDSKGRLWAALNNGVAMRESGEEEWTSFTSANSGFTNDRAFSLLEDHLGNIWASFDNDDGVVAMYDGENWALNNMENTHVLTMFEDHNGDMWFGTWCCGVRKWERATDTWITYTAENSGLPSNNMWYGAIMEDEDYNMWFGTLAFGYDGGLAKFDGTDWTVYNTDNSDIAFNNIVGSLIDNDGNIWMAHWWTSGASKFDGSDFENFNTGNSGISSDAIQRIFQDSRGKLWFSGSEGLSIVDGENWEYLTNENSGLASHNVMSITEDSDGDLWFGTNNGLYKYNYTHFSKIWQGNGSDHMNFYALTATVDDTDLQPDDEIGIFDGDVCVGFGVLTEVLDGTNYLEIRVSLDDPLTTEIDGYTSGNSASFKIWDASEQQEIFITEVDYESGDNTFEIGASTWFYIGGKSQIEQEIALLDGWNIFSLNVMPENTDMLNVVQSLIDDENLVKVQDETGAAIEEIPGTGVWINNIGEWQITEGYKIRVDNTTAFSVTGSPVNDTIDIDLLSGWNIIGYPSLTSQEALAVLDELINTGVLVKVQDETGASIEQIPGIGTWINNIGDFEPGEGYKVRVTDDAVLTIFPITLTPEMELKSSKTIPVLSPFHYQPVWTGNGYDHMNVFFSDQTDDGKIFEPGDEIGIFDEGLCVGSGKIHFKNPDNLYSLIASADDPTTSEIDGFVEGNSLYFKIWRSSTNEEIELQDVEYETENKGTFENNGTAVLTIESLNWEVADIQFGLGDCYPNPFGNLTTIPFVTGQESEVDISIYNMLGMKVKTIVHDVYNSGEYMVTWDATNNGNVRVIPGMYICRMIAGEQVFEKIIEVFE